MVAPLVSGEEVCNLLFAIHKSEDLELFSVALVSEM